MNTATARFLGEQAERAKSGDAIAAAVQLLAEGIFGVNDGMTVREVYLQVVTAVSGSGDHAERWQALRGRATQASPPARVEDEEGGWADG